MSRRPRGSSSWGPVSTTESTAYDYVIVGGGSAGSVVASRLAAARPDATVLLIEAGTDGRGVDSDRRPAAVDQARRHRARLGLQLRPERLRGGPGGPAPARQGARRMQRDQRHAVVPRSRRRLRRLGAGGRGRLELRGPAAVLPAQRGLGRRPVRAPRRGRPDAGHPPERPAPDRGRHDRGRRRTGPRQARRPQLRRQRGRRPRQPEHRRGPPVQRRRRVPARLGAAARPRPGPGRGLDRRARRRRPTSPCSPGRRRSGSASRPGPAGARCDSVFHTVRGSAPPDPCPRRRWCSRSARSAPRNCWSGPASATRRHCARSASTVDRAAARRGPQPAGPPAAHGDELPRQAPPRPAPRQRRRRDDELAQLARAPPRPARLRRAGPARLPGRRRPLRPGGRRRACSRSPRG